MRWLLVFDNADNIDIIHDFWPIANKGAVVVTSQNPTAGSCLASQESELRPLSESDGIAFTRQDRKAMKIPIATLLRYRSPWAIYPLP